MAAWLTGHGGLRYGVGMILTALLVAQTALPGLPAVEPAGVEPGAFVAEIAEAHGEDAYDRRAAVAADVRVEFGGEVRHDGPVTFTTSLGRTRLESGGKTIVFDGEQVHVSPAGALAGGERFAALTWPYFLAAAFKLDDGGVVLADGGRRPLTGGPEPAVRMTFEPGTGDAPDDWYLIWKADDGTLAALAYIVTYFPDREPVPHVAVYRSFDTVDGVEMPSEITIHDWSADGGTVAEAIGSITATDYRFVEPEPGTFEAPADSAVDALPGEE